MNWSGTKNKRLLFPMLCCLLLFSAPLHAAGYGPIQKVFSKTGDGGALWGIVIFEAAGNKIVDSLNPDKMFYPSSNLKLFTTWAAMNILGPDYCWKTRISFRKADLSGGVLNGPLVVTGSGDPTISLRFFPNLEPLAQAAAKLKALGVNRLGGYILIDDRAFQGDNRAPGWMYDDLPWYYATPVGAFSVEENQVQVVVEPGGKAGDPAKVKIIPNWSFISIDNQAATSAATEEPSLVFHRITADNVLLIEGAIPLGSKADNEKVAVDDPALFGGGILVQFLKNAGFTVDLQPARISRDSTSAPANSPDWVSVEIVSPPLREVIVPMNKKSINFIADQIFITLGFAAAGRGTWKTGAEAVLSTLPKAGIKPEELIIADGSGLSRYSMVSPRQIVKLLRAAYSAGFSRDYMASLPVGGLNGSLSWRFDKSRLSQRIWAKTGTSTGHSAISGYFLSPKDRLFIFSVISSNYIAKAGPIRAIQDAILDAAAGN